MLIVDAPTESAQENIAGTPVDDLKAFVGKEAPIYLHHWRTITASSYKMGWHWGAALLTGFWLLYRRMYVWFLVYFCVSLVFMFPGGLSGGLWMLVSTVAIGLYGHWFYFQHARHKLVRVHAVRDKAERHALAARLGGVDYISPIIFGAVLVVLAAIFFGLIMIFLASLLGRFF